jgi:hypothetical protein
VDIEDKAAAVVTRLIRGTREGDIKWSQIDAARIEYPGADVFGFAYTTQYEQQNVAVFEVTYKDYSELTDEWYTATRVVIAMVDEKRRIEWEFPKLPNARDLLEAVQFHTAGVESFFDRVLKGKS